MDKISKDNMDKYFSNGDLSETVDRAVESELFTEPLLVTIKRHITASDVTFISEMALISLYLEDDDGVHRYNPQWGDFAFDVTLVDSLTSVSALSLKIDDAWALLYETDILPVIESVVGHEAISRSKEFFKMSLNNEAARQNSRVDELVKTCEDQSRQLEGLLSITNAFGTKIEDEGLSYSAIVGALNGANNMDPQALVNNVLGFQRASAGEEAETDEHLVKI